MALSFSLVFLIFEYVGDEKFVFVFGLEKLVCLFVGFCNLSNSHLGAWLGGYKVY